jgi:diguanylate cyclase (GGDEF)-like protein
MSAAGGRRTAAARGNAGLQQALAALVDGADVHDDSRLEQAAIRWSQRVGSTREVVAMVGEIRSGAPLTREREAVLQRITLAAVSAVSEREVREALTDPLTGLATRARMEHEAQHVVAVSLREKRPLTAVVLDVDGLKKINDEQGHAAGDAALAAVGRAIRQHVRRTDRAFRWGGDEFVLLMPSTTEQGARLVVERIQRAAGTPTSAGVALHRGGSNAVDVATWLSEADADLYRTRRSARGGGPVVRASRKHVVRHLPRSLAVALAVAAAGVGGVAATTAANSLGLDRAPLGMLPAAPSEGSGTLVRDAAPPRVSTPVTRPRVAPAASKPAPSRASGPTVVAPTRTSVQVPRVRVPVPAVKPPVAPPITPPAVEPDEAVNPPQRPSGLVQRLLNGVGNVIGVLN